MFEFQWPWLALLLPLPLLVWRFWRGRDGASVGREADQAILIHPAVERAEHAFGASIPSLPVGMLAQIALLGTVWVALVGALMGPQRLETFSEVSSPGYDLMIAVDTSRSMAALDFSLDGRSVNRMSVIKGVLGRFIDGRQGDRVGLIVFGDEAVMQSPLTMDVGMVKGLLNLTEPGMVGNATAIGDAVAVAIKKLRDRPEGSRILLLVTDGENTAGSMPPHEAARLAAHYKIRIYTVGVGTTGLVPFPDEHGRITHEKMEIDEATLTELASMTGGAYFRATDSNALDEIYRRIDALEKTEAETRSVRVPHPLYRWPLGIGMLALLGLALLSLGRRTA